MHRPDERRLWLHPLLFAVYPALSLLAANIDQVPLAQGLRMALVSLLLGVLVYLGLAVLLRRAGNAALASSLIVLVLLSYGRLYDGLKAVGLPGESVVRHRYLIPACLALLGVGAAWCARRRDTSRLNRTLNVVALAAVALPTMGIAYYQGNALRGVNEPGVECTLQPPVGRPLPDVYILVMDGYARDDVLRELHDHDNSAFLDSLGELGFYVAHGSLSNYRPTIMSLSSMLNMAYVQDFPELFGARPGNQWDVLRLVKRNRVRHELECLGYVTVAFEAGFLTDWDDADFYLARQGGAYSGLGLSGTASRLEYMFLETTVGRVLTDGWTAAKTGAPPETWDAKADLRERILFTFDKLERISNLPSPKLVFVHVLSPHAPFVFGPNGEPVDEADFESEFSGAEWERKAYADQVTFLNGRLLGAIEAILAESELQPVIVLMGDHGWASRDLEDQLSNLSAYLVPDTVALYPTISPVNTFRLIFDGVFGGSLGTLPDTSYHSTGQEKFEFTVVPNTWHPEEP